MTSAWEVTELTGTVAELHARPMGAFSRRVTVMHPRDAAIVLASTQSVSALDHTAVARAGLSVVRRRSGGGAVVVRPGQMSWLDIEIPRDDPLWHDDVVEAARWVGERCAAAFETLAVRDVAVNAHMRRTPWTPLVCFAGLGPGEVTISGHKVLGVSQRRTREGARFQVSVLHEWDPVEMASLFDLSPGDRGELVGALGEATSVSPVDSASLLPRLVEALTST